MIDPTTLFSYEPTIDQRTIHDRVMVVTLGSFGDVGASQAQVDEHLLNTLTHRKIGTFDVDQIMDYRGHRPPIDFDQDHYDNYVPPSMTLHEVVDKSGNPFLLLTGPEPALQWERVSATIEWLTDQMDVQLVVTAQGVPMPVPHTRPINLLKVATRPELIPGNRGSGSFRMSSSFLAMMTQRLGEKGRDVIGLVARVPQYLADTEYPDGAIAMVNGLNELAGLNIPVASLEQASHLARAQIDAQVEQSEELQQMIGQMEEQYDRYMQDHSLPMNEEDIPDADEIGQEMEDYLASLDPGTPDSDKGPQVGPVDHDEDEHHSDHHGDNGPRDGHHGPQPPADPDIPND